jgi:hypothetical protein
MVKAAAKTKIPVGITYELFWDSPRDAEIRLKLSASRKNPPKPAAPTSSDVIQGKGGVFSLAGGRAAWKEGVLAGNRRAEGCGLR